MKAHRRTVQKLKPHKPIWTITVDDRSRITLRQDGYAIAVFEPGIKRSQMHDVVDALNETSIGS